MKNIKTHIVEQLADNLCNLTVNSLSRVIAGEYRPSLHVAKWLAFVTETQTYIWNDPALIKERRAAVAKLARRLGMSYHIGRGRPKGERWLK